MLVVRYLGCSPYLYYIDYRYDRQMVEITFDPAQMAFVCQPAGSAEPILVPARGLTKTDLQGELAALLALPAYQLALPWAPDARRRLELARCLTGTGS